MRTAVVLLFALSLSLGCGSPSPTDRCCHPEERKCSIDPRNGFTYPTACYRCECLTCDVRTVAHTFCKYFNCPAGVLCEGAVCDVETVKVGSEREVVDHGPCP